MPVTYLFPREKALTALLAVEDARARRYLQEALSRAGYRSDLCSDIRTMLEPRRTEGHAFVILSEGPGRLEVLLRLRREGAAIPAILLSPAPGRSGDAEVPDLVHLAAPFTLRTLQAAIARASAAPVD